MICPGCQKEVRQPHPSCLTRVAAQAQGRRRRAGQAPAREAGIADMTQSQRDAILRRINKPKE